MAVGEGIVWNESLPDNSVVAHLIDDYNIDLRVGVRSRLDREHIWPSSQTGTGQGGHHRFVTFQQQTGAPILIASSGMVGCVYVGSSGAGYPFVIENSAGQTVTLAARPNATSTAIGIAVVSGGTLGSIPICSSANAVGLAVLAGPTSTTASKFLFVSANDSTGGVQAPTWVLASTGLSGALGAWDSKVVDTVYQATADGIVCAYTNETNIQDTVCYTDGSNPPTTVRTRVKKGNDDIGLFSLTMQVRKNDYWKVTGSANTIFWIPLGA